MLTLLAQEGAMQEPFFELDATWTMFLSGVLLPIFVGVITKSRLHPGWKAIIHALLAAIAGMVNTAITLDGVAIISRESMVLAFMTWITGIAAYWGFLIPTRIAPKVTSATANVGIGPSTTTATGTTVREV